jgi:cytochrome c553
LSRASERDKAIAGGSLRRKILRQVKQSLRGLIVAQAFIFVSFQAFSGTLEDRLAPCLACHDEKGQSANSDVPFLGAQPEFFISVQLYMFRENMRTAEPMNSMLKELSDEELQRMAATISKLPSPPPAAKPTDPARLYSARELIEQHRCNFCHNGNFSGEKSAPRLAGQREDYLVKALREYKNNTRRAYDTSVADAIYPNILDLAHYLARVGS